MTDGDGCGTDSIVIVFDVFPLINIKNFKNYCGVSDLIEYWNTV